MSEEQPEMLEEDAPLNIRRYTASLEKPKHMLFKPGVGRWVLYKDAAEELARLEEIYQDYLNTMNDRIQTVDAIRSEQARQITELQQALKAMVEIEEARKETVDGQAVDITNVQRIGTDD